jgi:hypothetical protein
MGVTPAPGAVASVAARPLTDRLAVTYFIRSADPSSDTIIDLVVFMRGQPGWTKRKPEWRSATKPLAVSQFSWPDLLFRVELDPRTGEVTLTGLGHPVTTKGNVVVVDGFGGSSIQVTYDEKMEALRAPAKDDPMEVLLERSVKLQEAVGLSERPGVPAGVAFSGGDGRGCERRVIISGTTKELVGIAAEHAWLLSKYPGCKLLMQSLRECKGQPTDVMKIKTAAGEELEIHFDISAFFGKGFAP